MKQSLYCIAILLFVLSSCKKDDEKKSTIVQNLDSYSISSLAIDINKTLWIGTDTGLFKSTELGYELIDLGVSDPVKALLFDNSINTLWIGTTEGLFQMNLSNTDSPIVTIAIDQLSNPTIISAYIDENSVKWFGTETGFTRYDQDKWQKDQFKMNITGAITSIQFHGYAINSIGMWDGDYYFATAGNKLWRTKDWKTSVDAFTGATMWDQPYNGFAIADTMYAVFIDSKGQQWFGGKEGVQVHIGHDPKEENTSYYDELVNSKVHCIAEDSKGNIWVGTENGISIYDGSNWTTSTTSLANNYITSILFENNKVWIGTKKGLFDINY